MNNENKKIIKDIIISLLIVIVIILIVSIIFYNKISLSHVLPEVQEYELTNEMKEEIKIDTDTGIETINTVTTYYIDATELDKYEKTNEYNKGKSNPFAAENEISSSNSSTNENSTSGTSSSSEDTNFYKDDGTK